MKMTGKEDFMREALRLSEESVRSGGGPFGAVVVKQGRIIGRGANSVTLSNDPTAHAEVAAIREACRAENTFSLDGCELYTSCEPCPMCLSAAYWAGIRAIYYGNDRHDAARIGFDDSYIYDQLALPVGRRDVPTARLIPAEAANAFRLWSEKEDKVEY